MSESSSFLSKLNLDLDEYIINKIVGGEFLTKIGERSKEDDDTLVRTLSKGASPDRVFHENIKAEMIKFKEAKNKENTHLNLFLSACLGSTRFDYWQYNNKQ